MTWITLALAILPKFLVSVGQLIKETKELISAIRRALRDGQLSKEEAKEIISEGFDIGSTMLDLAHKINE
jgi:hypothetical protein